MEDLSHKAQQTARRNLAQRMERFLDGAGDRTLTQWETDLLCRVLALLKTHQYRVGEDVMLQVERPDLYCSGKARASVANVSALTVAEVRAQLAGLLADE